MAGIGPVDGGILIQQKRGGTGKGGRERRWPEKSSQRTPVKELAEPGQEKMEQESQHGAERGKKFTGGQETL